MLEANFAKMIKQIATPSVLTILLFIFVSCSRDTVPVRGDVVRVVGNQMPSPDLPPSIPAGYAAEVHFYEAARASGAKPAGLASHYHSTGTRLVRRVTSGRDGRFRLRLPEGVYSVMLARDSLSYANILDGNGILNPLEVRRGARVRMRLLADWDATY